MLISKQWSGLGQTVGNELAGKAIVITGSSRGIGRGLAEACARAGGSVVISSRNTAAVTRAVDELKASGARVTGFPADVAKYQDLEFLLAHSVKAFGKVDIWINNAGVSGGYRTLVAMSPEEIDEVVRINLVGTFNGCRVAIPYFIQQGQGMVINMNGKGGRGEASPFQAPYAATKAAVTSLTRSLARENRQYRLSINCLFPGMVETDMYRNIKSCAETENQLKVLRVILNQVGVPLAEVGRLVVRMCAEEPGKTTGRAFTTAKPWRRLRDTARLAFFFARYRPGQAAES
jgi:NAD(P)-dependent dehydrogenase (short-subunit alcohol dehydrogenase family)